MLFPSKYWSVAAASFVLVAVLASSCEHALPPSSPRPDTAAVASVAVSPASPSVQVGLTVQLTATPKDANGNPLAGRLVTWATSDSGVARVSATGLVTGRT